jgi:hypothetical protein
MELKLDMLLLVVNFLGMGLEVDVTSKVVGASDRRRNSLQLSNLEGLPEPSRGSNLEDDDDCRIELIILTAFSDRPDFSRFSSSLFLVLRTTLVSLSVPFPSDAFCSFGVSFWILETSLGAAKAESLGWIDEASFFNQGYI